MAKKRTVKTRALKAKKAVRAKATVKVAARAKPTVFSQPITALQNGFSSLMNCFK